MLKRLALNIIDIHGKLFLGQKSPFAQFEGNVRADEHNLILGIRTVFVESTNSAAMQCPCKSPIIMCCRHRRPKESNM